MILTQFSLLIPAFSLPCSPHVLPLMLRPARNAPLPSRRILSFGYTLSPVKSSAQHHSTIFIYQNPVITASKVYFSTSLPSQNSLGHHCTSPEPQQQLPDQFPSSASFTTCLQPRQLNTPDVLCWHSEVVLWNLHGVYMFI